MNAPASTRRVFLQRVSLTAATGLALPAALLAQSDPPPPPLPADRVKAFVIAGHGNLAQVKTMLAETPTLLNAAWDWKEGDFETALEGAGHVGNREIAEYLIGQGARANVFVLAMLGQLELVRGLLTAYPALRTSTGPHGLGLMHHAQKGGEAAAGVVAYLESLGLK